MEQHILISAVTSNGETLQDNDPEKLLRLPAHIAESAVNPNFQTTLTNDMAQRLQTLLNQTTERNLGYFEQEVQKLDDWVDDLKQGLEQEIKETDREIKAARRTAATSATLEEKLSWQKKQRELENKRSRQRRELFDRQDEIEEQRNRLIEELEEQLKQEVEEEELFFIEWEMV
ncbi:DEAD/DEAH box helicase [Aggregatibacter actinomycetemcomitans]